MDNPHSFHFLTAGTLLTRHTDDSVFGAAGVVTIDPTASRPSGDKPCISLVLLLLLPMLPAMSSLL